MSKDEAARALVGILGTILKMSDDAEARGGATSLAGIASLHKMQKSIQNNAKRMAEVAAMVVTP